MQYSVKHITINKSVFNENDYKYIDPDNLSETVYKFIFPTTKTSDGVFGNDMYIAIANIIKLQYLLPVKYLKVNDDSFSYIAQKSCTAGENVSIENAAVQIEPLNANFAKQICYTHINQMIPIGTVFYIHTEIPYKPDSTRKLLTSASIKTDESDLDKLILSESEKNRIKNPTTVLCNQCIAYGALDIGSRLDMKMSVEWNDGYESMTLFRFRRPEDNVLEFIVYDHFNVDIKYILNLMKKDEKLEISAEQRKFLNELLDKMIAAVK